MSTTFPSADLRCAATLVRPDGTDRTGPRPCVVMANGLGGVRAGALEVTARAFARAGYVVLLFDYRYCGTSEGEPRGLIDIGAQRADYRAAVEHARGLPSVDPDGIAVWGTSFSAGHAVATAAGDRRIAAVVLQNPYLDGRASAHTGLRTTSFAATLRLLGRSVADAWRAHRGRAPIRVPLAGEPGSVALITAPGAPTGFRDILPPGPVGWEATVPARIALHIPRDRPVLLAPLLRCPVLVCVATRDTITPTGPARRLARDAPAGRLVAHPVDHFDVFRPPWRDRFAEDQVSFLREVLGASLPEA